MKPYVFDPSAPSLRGSKTTEAISVYKIAALPEFTLSKILRFAQNDKSEGVARNDILGMVSTEPPNKINNVRAVFKAFANMKLDRKA